MTNNHHIEELIEKIVNCKTCEEQEHAHWGKGFCSECGVFDTEYYRFCHEESRSFKEILEFLLDQAANPLLRGAACAQGLADGATKERGNNIIARNIDGKPKKDLPF